MATAASPSAVPEVGDAWAYVLCPACSVPALRRREFRVEALAIPS